ncbi:hypothetical protein MBLNU230_g5416t1 [Neophaeotheca triangularis]
MASQQPKWALITGVSQGGLGDALCEAFLASRINVIATAKELSLLAYLQVAEQKQLHCLELDVTCSTSIRLAAEQTSRITNGRLDYLVNNAGYGYMTPLLDAEIALVKRQFDVNVFGLLEVSQVFFPLVRAAKGVIADQASITGLPSVSQAFIGVYGASKACVVDLGEVMESEMAPFGVKVVTMVIGDVQTGFWQTASDMGARVQESSLYSPIKAHAEGMMRGTVREQKGPTERSEWARRVVSDLLLPHPPSIIRRGYRASLMYWMSWLTPRSVIMWLLGRYAKLDELKSIVEAKEASKTK